MALQKEIELENGIVVSYHRITSSNKITNNNTIIEVASYINESKRQQEIDALNTSEIETPITEDQNGETIVQKTSISTNIFINTTFINKEYTEDETIKDLYDYLKTTEKFKGSVDV